MTSCQIWRHEKKSNELFFMLPNLMNLILEQMGVQRYYESQLNLEAQEHDITFTMGHDLIKKAIFIANETFITFMSIEF